MKVVISGSRSLTEQKHRDFIDKNLFLCIPCLITEIRMGDAAGVDQIVLDILRKEFDPEELASVKVYKPNWNTHGKQAGFIRDAEMADGADLLVAFWDGKSKGTKAMIDRPFPKKIIYTLDIEKEEEQRGQETTTDFV